MREIGIVVAMSLNGVIGQNGNIPWKIRSDLANFRKLTIGHSVIMGRKTYESIGGPLVNRTNIILTSNPDYYAPGCLVATSVASAIDMAGDEQIFIIGGQKVYEQLLPVASKLYVTTVQCYAAGDTWFGFSPYDWDLQESRLLRACDGDDYDYNYSVYKRSK